MRITMYMGDCIPGWFDKDPDTHPISGSETAVIRLSRELRKRGHTVDMGGDLPGGDVALVKRKLDTAVDATRLYDRVWFWTGDDIDQPWFEWLNPFRLQEFNTKIAGIFAISDYQRARFAEAGLDREKIRLIRYGIPDDLMGVPLTPRDPVCVYCSMPYRGLAYLCGYWPLIRETVPKAVLRVFSSSSIVGGEDTADEKDIFGRLAQLDGVELRGVLPQRELHQELQQARVMVYPNTFAETFSVAVLEACAAGCVPVTTHLGALPERGCITVLAAPGTVEYRRMFVGAATSLLTNDDMWHMYAELGQYGIDKYRWSIIAKEVEYWLSKG